MFTVWEGNKVSEILIENLGGIGYIFYALSIITSLTVIGGLMTAKDYEEGSDRRKDVYKLTRNSLMLAIVLLVIGIIIPKPSQISEYHKAQKTEGK